MTIKKADATQIKNDINHKHKEKEVNRVVWWFFMM